MIGKTISHYKILEKIGEGGMGVVYKAQDTKLDREVAIKVLPEKFMEDLDRLSRFKREAKLLASLNHPNIAAIYGIEEHEDVQFLVLELAEGENLASWIDAKKFDVRETLDICRQIAEALEAAHDKGIIHRDLKPSNIKVTSDSKVKVLDFGLAKAFELGKTPDVDLTKSPTMTVDSSRPGIIIGTAGYMSPEQARGKPLDKRTDIWSFGCILYEMLTGNKVFRGETVSDSIAAVLEREPDWQELPDSTPVRVHNLLRRCLKKDPHRRLHDIADARIEIEEIQSETSEALQPPSEIAERKAPSRPWSHVWPYVLLVIITAILTGTVVWLLMRSTDSAIPVETGPMKSIVVLPFINMSPEEGQEYFCDGLTEQIITALSNIRELKVVARTSAFSFKGKDMDIRDIGNRLNVETILEGSVRKAGDTLRVTAQLIKVEDGYHLWSEQFDRKMDDVFAIQDEVTLAIVDKLKLDLLSDEKPKLVKRYTENIDAYNLYLMGRYYWNKRTGEGLRKGLDLFQQAIEKDPTYTLAYAGVADSYNLLGYYYHMPSMEALPKAKIAAERALEIDESLAEAHTSLAWVSMFYDWDWKAAEKEYKRAIELNPNYATAHHWYSFYLMILGRRDESLDEARLAVTLDPLSLQVNMHLASMFNLAEQYTQAIEEFKRVLEMNPSYVLAHQELGHTYMGLEMYDNALTEYHKVIELLGTRTPSIISDLGYLYAMTGKTDQAKKLLEELQSLSEKMYVSPWGFAVIHLGLGQIDQAYECLEKAYKERDHSIIVFKIVTYFEDFRSMPRFKALLQKVGFDL